LRRKRSPGERGDTVQKLRVASTAPAVLILAATLLACSTSSPAAQASQSADSAATAGAESTPAPAESTPEPPSSAAPSLGSVRDMDVCALLTTEEIEEVTGIEFIEGEAMELSTETAGCQWEASDNSLTYVQLYVAAFDQETFDLGRNRDSAEELTEPLGDDAYRREVTSYYPAGILQIKQDEYFIEFGLHVEDGDADTMKAQSFELAELFLSRL
jgi:Protein of unknown function (DUF3558)